MGFGMAGGGGGISVSSQYGRLLNAPTVQKELKLSEEQIAKIREAGDKAQAAMRDMFSGMGNSRELSAEERRAMAVESGKKMQAQQEETKKAIEAVLQPTQLERLKGIALQTSGVQSLNDKQIQQELKLEEYQTAAIRLIGDRSGKKTRELYGRGADFQAAGAKMQELRTEAEKQIMDVLTDEQKALLDKMKGDKLEIPDSELRGFGGRGRGGFGGPGGGGPGGRAAGGGAPGADAPADRGGGQGPNP
jgi:hypothetical protein